MITKISVKNFRSIKSLDTELSKLTVLIGANGSGKSNLVKLIELIGDISQSGVSMAINKRGGAEWMLPKSLPKKLMQSTPVEISYAAVFKGPQPKGYNFPEKRISVEHNLNLKFKTGGLPHVLSENIQLNDVLHVAKALTGSVADFSDVDDGSPTHPNGISSFTVGFEEKGAVKIKCSPEVDKENMDDYIRWLGLSKKLFNDDPRSFYSTLKRMWDNKGVTNIRGARAQLKKGNYSLLDPDVKTVLDFCPQFHRFLGELVDIARYDLLLHELRQEQSLSDEYSLTTYGNNMPSILRNLKGKENTQEWTRLKETFCAIAPHIVQFGASRLNTNKEFIRFTESKFGRSVESWDASDGTLRALGVMLAIESARIGATVIIEEPEQNLHPWAIRILMRYIRDMIERKNLQVIITTHSQQVLESANPNEVLIASRTIESGTSFKRVADEYPDLKPIELGDLWVQGLLGGVPSYAD